MDVNILLVIFPIAISVTALFFSVKSATYTKKKQKIQNALKQADEYRKILDQISFVKMIIEDEKHKAVLEIINSVDEKDMNEFTIEEAKGIFPGIYYEELYKFFKENVTLDPSVVYDNCIIYATSISYNFDNVKNYFAEDSPRYRNILNYIFKRKIVENLNFLEYFAMFLNQNLSDEDTIYQSLHQTYIDNVKRLYWVIAFLNSKDKNADKSFTNLITLFIKWRDKRQIHLTRDEDKIEQIKKEYNKIRAMKEKINKKVEKSYKKIKKIEDKKDFSKPKPKID